MVLRFLKSPIREGQSLKGLLLSFFRSPIDASIEFVQRAVHAFDNISKSQREKKKGTISLRDISQEESYIDETVLHLLNHLILSRKKNEYKEKSKAN